MLPLLWENLAQILFWFLWLHRYVRFIVNTISHWCYKSVPIPADPKYSSKDVTVIIPTIHNNFEELKESMQSILACQPFELLLVTTSDKYDKLVSFAKTLEVSNIRIFHVPIANKRIQVCEAIPKVKTDIIVMADDDVTWPSTILPWLLAPFENKKIGGVGPCQRVKRLSTGDFSALQYNWLGAAYIERRNFEISATHGIDGGTSCMSGRTCAFRREILQNPLFLVGFETERWGQYQLNADDDNFVTRWLVSNGWKTWIQYNRQCEIETTLENDHKFLYQCSRWARSNWRSNYTSLFTERHVWTQQPWSTYALHIATFTSLSIIFDPLIVYLTCKVFGWNAMIAQLIFMFVVVKTVKLVGLFKRNPMDIVYYPTSVVFGYFHGLIKLWALFTLRITSWGSRADGDTNDNERMSPRARRSESITLPPGNHPVLVRYKDEKDFFTTSEKQIDSDSDDFSESDLDFGTDASYDYNDSNDDTSSDSQAMKPRGR
ncbi:glycosyltransferase family 2 protein [Mollisia scopiformis]|uniref:Glycosyltransferase family 2 protein n=1 Tax=Mollisia scopiformis TaxID=149040 RepID=A0A132B8F3_MOLSC|nr:glycosyltransferase family 2 protein [Mollisia scopiformis]KUJ08688.1 glycosyltransferase family 2 protein [Mollisia scopiformis]